MRQEEERKYKEAENKARQEEATRRQKDVQEKIRNDKIINMTLFYIGVGMLILIVFIYATEPSILLENKSKGEIHTQTNQQSSSSETSIQNEDLTNQEEHNEPIVSNETSLNPSNSSVVGLGDNAQVVMSVMGTPDKVEHYDYLGDTWYYGEGLSASEITFNVDG